MSVWALSLLVCWAGLSLAAEPGPGCVWLFDHQHFAGEKKEYCGLGDHSQLEDFNDRAESIKVAPGVEVELYAGTEDSGHGTRAFDESAYTLGDLNHVLSTLKITKVDAVPKGCVQLFDSPNYQGEMKQFCGYGDHSVLHWNDRTESVKVSKGMTVDLYNGDEHSGHGTKTVSEDVADLGNFKHIISSLKIKLIDDMPEGCVYFYDHTNWGGEKKEYCGLGDHSQLADFNDRAESMKISYGVVVELYAGTETSGHGTRTAHMSSLDLGSFKHVLSTIKIISTTGVKAGCVWLFDKTNFEGARKEVCGVGPEVSVMDNFNDKAESVIVAKGVTAELYAGSQTSGHGTLTVDGDMADLGSYKHRISHVRILSASPAA